MQSNAITNTWNVLLYMKLPLPPSCMLSAHNCQRLHPAQARFSLATQKSWACYTDPKALEATLGQKLRVAATAGTLLAEHHCRSTAAIDVHQPPATCRRLPQQTSAMSETSRRPAPRPGPGMCGCTQNVRPQPRSASPMETSPSSFMNVLQADDNMSTALRPAIQQRVSSGNILEASGQQSSGVTTPRGAAVSGPVQSGLVQGGQQHAAAS